MLEFGPPAPDHIVDPATRKFAHGRTKNGPIFIGEVDTNTNKVDGRGILIGKQTYVQIGHFKQGKAHGSCLEVYEDGHMQFGNFTNGTANGTFDVTLPDGTNFTEEWEMGEIKAISRDPPPELLQKWQDEVDAARADMAWSTQDQEDIEE